MCYDGFEIEVNLFRFGHFKVGRCWCKIIGLSHLKGWKECLQAKYNEIREKKTIKDSLVPLSIHLLTIFPPLL